MRECRQTRRYAIGLNAGAATAERGLSLSDQQPIAMIVVSEGRRFCRQPLTGHFQSFASDRLRQANDLAHK